jgi:hypothetical protein
MLIKNLFIYNFIIHASILNVVLSHSWLACTNYKINGNNPINYDVNQCGGFPRDYEMQYQSILHDDMLE